MVRFVAFDLVMFSVVLWLRLCCFVDLGWLVGCFGTLCLFCTILITFV